MKRISIRLRRFSAELMLWGLHSTDWFLKTGPILAHFLMSTPTCQIFLSSCCWFSSAAVLLKKLSGILLLSVREIAFKLMQKPASVLCSGDSTGGVQLGGTTTDDSAVSQNHTHCHLPQCSALEEGGEGIKSSVSWSSLSLDFWHGAIAGRPDCWLFC